MTTDSVSPDGATCRPNISAAGRRRRIMFGYANAAIALMGFAGGIAFSTPWPLRLLVALPAMMSAIGFLQARRNTCVARAREGMFENNDFSRTKMGDADVAASRKVAATIQRDALLIGAGTAALAVLSSFVR